MVDTSLRARVLLYFDHYDDRAPSDRTVSAMGTLDLGRERVVARVTLLSTLASEQLVKRTTVTLDDESDRNAESFTDAGRNRTPETRSGVVDDP